MSFKNHIENDIDMVFMNLEEFAEKHIINGIECVCIIQDIISNDELSLSKNGDYYPVVYGNTKSINVAKKLLPDTPVYGQRLWLDGAIFTVTSVSDDMGMLTIIVEGDSR